MNKEMNKNTFHRKRLTNLCHPPGRYSPVIKTQQHTDASKEKGRIMVREERSSDTMLNSSLTGRTDQEVDWPSDTDTNGRYFQPSGTGLSRIDQAAVRLKNDREMVSKSHNRKME